MLYGIGNVSIGTNGLTASSLLGQNLAFSQCVASIAFNAESNSVKANCFVNGVLQKKASRINSENFMVELTYEYASWSELQLLYGEVAKSQSNVYVPTSRTVVPTAATFTVADINTANANAASFRLYNATTEKFMTLAVGAPGASEYSIAAATGVVTVNASAIGQTLIYKFDKRYTSIESIGSGFEGDATDQLSNLNLTAILSSSIYPQGIVLVADRLERINTPSFSIAGDKATITIQYDLITLPGRLKPFTMYKLNGAVAA
jgi:hypothetical protein